MAYQCPGRRCGGRNPHPNPLNNDTKNEQNEHLKVCRKPCPAPTRNSADIRDTLENAFKDMLDIEFTIQEGILYMLQCRAGKRTGTAA